MTLLEAYEELQLALQLDLEQGVAWMNEEASAQFARQFPALIATMNHIREALDDGEGD